MRVEENPQLPVWEDMTGVEPQPPEEWLAQAQSVADDGPPPQLIRTVNLLDLPDHGLSDEEDVEAIAEAIVNRAKEGLDDIFAHPDYNTTEGADGEDWARAVAEHQTGIPYTQPVYFYDGPQPRIAKAIVENSRLPLAGQCQQSVTTALCIGGWDGGPYGDIGSGIDAQPSAARLGASWTDVPLLLSQWTDEQWAAVTVGSCLFWSAPASVSRGSGHVVMILRKHPTERKWQLWDTTTSFNDPVTHPAAVKGARMLWESHWWPYITKTLSGGRWQFRGIAKIHDLGTVRADLKPRGRCRLLLRRRRDSKLLYRSAWMSMEQEGWPISWLLRSMRGAPFFQTIEATWCVNSACDKPSTHTPDNRPLLDVSCDAKGNARMTWTPVQGLHNRPHLADWSPTATLGVSG